MAARRTRAAARADASRRCAGPFAADRVCSVFQRASPTCAEALNVLASSLLHGNRYSIFVLTTELRLPAIYQWPETAQEGGLLAYGPRFTDVFRQLARQLEKVLRGHEA
jgi:putative tryptophan/tyrosine transport system substrate-binding protein